MDVSSLGFAVPQPVLGPGRAAWRASSACYSGHRFACYMRAVVKAYITPFEPTRSSGGSAPNLRVMPCGYAL